MSTLSAAVEYLMRHAAPEISLEVEGETGHLQKTTSFSAPVSLSGGETFEVADKNGDFGGSGVQLSSHMTDGFFASPQQGVQSSADGSPGVRPIKSAQGTPVTSGQYSKAQLSPTKAPASIKGLPRLRTS